MEIKDKELLFFWVKADENSCFAKTGINFNPNYEFEFDYDRGHLYLSVLNSKNLFKNEPVCNLSLIIGKNGAGKSTLLKRIALLSPVPLYWNAKQSKESYAAYFFEKAEKQYYLAVLLISGEIVVLNNLDKDIQYKGEATITVVKYNTAPFHYLDDITKIYCSPFSIMDKKQGFVSLGPEDDSLSFAPGFFSFYGKSYFEKKSTLFKGQSRNYINAMVGSFNFESFAIADYLSLTSSDNLFWLKKRKLPFSVKIDSLFNRVYYSNDKTIADEYSKNLLDDIMKKVKGHIGTENYIGTLISNLIFECALAFGFTLENQCSLLNALNQLNRHMESRSLDEQSYYNTAKEEIKLAYSLFKNMPKKDLAYSIWAEMDYSSLAPLFKKIQSNHSDFIFKYLSFDFGFSDGELAILRLMVYFNLVSRGLDLSLNRKNEFKHNIWLCIDEMDSPLHPDVKREFIDLLMEAVKSHFNGHNVQLIVSTHDPILLSDVPNSNVVLLIKSETGETRVRKMEHKTFGANIFDLYRNSFFIDHPVGQFAKNYINNLYKRIKQHDYRSEDLAIVDYVGEPIIRNELKKELLKSGNVQTENKKRDELLEYLKEERNRINALISILESYDD